MRVWPVVIKLPLNSVKLLPPAIPETIAISLVKVWPVVIKLASVVLACVFNSPVAVVRFVISLSLEDI